MQNATTRYSSFSALMFGWISVTHVALAAATCMSNGHEVPCAELKAAMVWSVAVALVFLALIVWATVFWIMMLVHVVKHDTEKNLLMWVLLMVFTGIIGSLIYYFTVKRRLNVVRAAP